jgi:hypothetical protein
MAGKLRTLFTAHRWDRTDRVAAAEATLLDRAPVLEAAA